MKFDNLVLSKLKKEILMKKLILTIIMLLNTAYAIQVEDKFAANVEYRRIDLKVHHADCISSISIPNFTDPYCSTQIIMPNSGSARNFIFTSSNAPERKKVREGNIYFYLERKDLKCQAKVEVSRRYYTNDKILYVRFTFKKLTKKDHPSVVTCSKRLFEKYSNGNNLEMMISLNYLAPVK